MYKHCSAQIRLHRDCQLHLKNIVAIVRETPERALYIYIKVKPVQVCKQVPSVAV